MFLESVREQGKNSTHHSEEKAEHQEPIVVPRERWSHPEHRLADAGEPHDLHTTNSAAVTAETERNPRNGSIHPYFNI